MQNEPPRKGTNRNFALINKLIIADGMPLTAEAPAANSVATSSYNKLQHRTTGPYKILNVPSKTVVVDEKAVRDTVLVHMVSRAMNTTQNDGEHPTDTSARLAVKPHVFGRMTDNDN